MIFFNTKNLIIFIVILVIFINVIKKFIYRKYIENKTKKNRLIAIKIIDEFEEMLCRNNIKIPSEEREGNKDEACIYGTEYYKLEDSIIDILDSQNRGVEG